MAGYQIRLAKQSGGKAGKGCNKTSTVQVLHNSMLIKSFRFVVDSVSSHAKAIMRAEMYVYERKHRRTVR